MGGAVIKTLLCFELLSLCRQKLKELRGPTVTHIVYCGDYLRLGASISTPPAKSARERESVDIHTQKH